VIICLFITIGILVNKNVQANTIVERQAMLLNEFRHVDVAIVIQKQKYLQ